MFFKKLFIMLLMLIHSETSKELKNKLKEVRRILQNIEYNKKLEQYFPFLMKDPRGQDSKITFLDIPLEIVHKFASYYVEKKRNNNIINEIEKNKQEIDKLIQDPEKTQLLKATSNLHFVFEQKFGKNYYEILNKKTLNSVQNIYEMKNNIKSDKDRDEIKLAFEFLDSIKESCDEKEFTKPKNQNIKIFAIVLLTGIIALYFYSSKKEEIDLDNKVIVNND